MSGIASTQTPGPGLRQARRRKTRRRLRFPPREERSSAGSSAGRKVRPLARPRAAAEARQSFSRLAARRFASVRGAVLLVKLIEPLTVNGRQDIDCRSDALARRSAGPRTGPGQQLRRGLPGRSLGAKTHGATARTHLRHKTRRVPSSAFPPRATFRLEGAIPVFVTGRAQKTGKLAQIHRHTNCRTRVRIRADALCRGVRDEALSELCGAV